jgi:diguanylate cyclase (GGDEF)-like protein
MTGLVGDDWAFRSILMTQLALFGAGWGLALLVLADERRAMAHWCASALLFAGSMVLIQWAGPPLHLVWANPTVMLVNLVAYSLCGRGVDVFVNTRPRHDTLTLGAVLVCGSVILALGLKAPDDRVQVLVFSLGKAAILLGIPLLVARPLARAMGWPGTLVALLPSVAYGLLGLGKAAAHALNAPHGRPLSEDLLNTPGRVIVAMVSIGLFNFSFLFMLFSRLVVQLRHHALHDGLTGVLNRRAMDEQLQRLWQRHQHVPEASFCVVLVDVDHFKRVNDHHGHPVGDRVLCKVAQVLQEHVRPTDQVARFGGEEFLLLLPGASAEQAHAVAERVRQAVALAAVDLDGMPLRVTVSAGVARPRAGDHHAGQTLARADMALYFAKGAGRNRVAGDEGLQATAA